MAIDPIFQQSLIDEFMFITTNVTHGLGQMTAPVHALVVSMLQSGITKFYNAGYQDALKGAPVKPPLPDAPPGNLVLMPQQYQLLWTMLEQTGNRAYSAGYQDGMAANSVAELEKGAV